MRIRSKIAEQLLEAAGELGLAREEILSAVAIDAKSLEDPRGTIEWDTLAALTDQMWLMLGSDIERMRDLGRAAARAPSYVVLQQLARTVVSVRSLYEACARWLAPAAFPHISLACEVLSERRLRFVSSIPKPHAPCAAFFHMFEGVLIETSTLLGLARSTIVTSQVTPRALDVVIELPLSPSIVGRLRRALRAAVYSGRAVALLEEQRRLIADGLEAVQRSTGEMNELLDRLPDLVLIHRDGVILWKNRAVVRTLGYEECDDLVGRPVMDIIEPGSRELVLMRMRLPDGAEQPDLSEVRLLTRAGATVLIEALPRQIVSFEGRPARLVVGRDVTERMRLQQQLLIADRMASIGMLAAGVAHEVNNPLAYVLNNIEIATRELAPLGEATRQSREALGVALEGVDRIRTIVRDLLALSRVDDLAVGPVNVLAVVESTMHLARNEISQRAELVFEHRPVPLARGTVARLGQVLLNLLANALEAMPPGARDTNELRVVIRPAGTNGAVVEVSDNGVGISPEHAERIFDPFFTTKAPGSGTGLGLAISQRLVTEMGGELTFESALERGSTFRVTLPAADGEERERQQGSAQG